MKSVTLKSVFVTFFISVSSFSQTAPDSSDFLLSSYSLSTEEEASFNSTDGAISPFWNNWNTEAGHSNLDKIYMAPSTHTKASAAKTFDNDNDCNLTVKSAYGDAGIYFLFEATDNDFVDAGAVVPDSQKLDQPGLDPEYMNDAIDFFLDIDASTEILSRYLSNRDQRTASYVQYQYRYGGVAGPSSIVRINMFDTTWKGTGDPTKYTHITVEQAKAKGILFEVVPIAPTKKNQEWLVPWSQIGWGVQKPLEGKKFAFIAGYNDVDSGKTDSDILRWKFYCDAYCPRGNWGDILFSTSLTQALPVANPLRTQGKNIFEATSKNAQFSLRGQKILEKNLSSKNLGCNVVVSQRGINGVVKSVKLTMTR